MTATASNPIRIDSDGLYDDDLLYAALGLSAATLARARRDRRLRFRREGRRTLYLGRWVLDWLTADDQQEAAHA
jgi:hypothetical protein